MEDTTLMPIGNNSEIVIYQPDADVKLEVRLNGETVWLNRQQMAVLFDRDVKTIGKHVNTMRWRKNWTVFQLSQILRQLPQTVKHTKSNTTISMSSFQLDIV